MVGGADADDRRRGDGAAVAAPSGRRRSNASQRWPTRRLAGRVLRRQAARVRGTAHARRDDQPHARRPARVAARRARVRRGRRRQGRRVRRHPWPAEAGRRGAGVRHACSTSSRSSGSRSAPAVSGLLPIPEIQYLAYLHNAEDQLRGEAASLSFFSQGRVPQPDGGARRRARLPEGLRRPLPQRQRGRRAARHPRAGDRLPRPSGRRRRRCCAPAWPRPSPTARCRVFLEPIALYHTRDLHAAGDDGWLAPYAAPDGWAAAHVPIGRAGSRATATT